MLKYYAIIRGAAEAIESAAMGAVNALGDGRVEQEPHFTDRMLGRIEQAMDGYEHNGVRWNAKTLTDRGRGAQESTYGADFMGVASIELPGLSVKKGFLAQAKLIEPGAYLSQTEYDRMARRCNTMLKYTPDSFVFMYSSTSIRIVPAITVVSSERINPHELYSRAVSRFYEEHFSCFIGDRKISAPSVDVLEAMANEYRARSALALFAKALQDT